jgi:metal-dependent amidase/aminoacylase/carboxypeptidase family protein
VLGYVNVAALRQHIRSTDRVHGVFTRAGDRPNVVPDLTEMEWMVRSARLAGLEPLKERVVACLRAGADATGCEIEVQFTGRDYADMVDNPVLLRLYAANAAVTGRTLLDPRENRSPVVGSTDMGNVSYQVPSIHPMIAVAPGNVSIHSHEFTEHARSESGDRAVLDGARAMAMTVADLWGNPALVEEVRAAFSPPPPA